MENTRDKMLQVMQRQQRSTIAGLADTVGINPISVRHHLTNLQVEGLVSVEEERHGVGRPRLVYFLTEKGREQFPSRYLRLTSRLLDQLKESLPAAVVNKLFLQIAEDMTGDHASQMATLSMEERLEFMKSLLAREGFTVEWEKAGDQYQIHEITCPYLHIGQSHPEVCSLDQMIISKMLAMPAEKVQCILRGDAMCTYVVQAGG